MKKSQIKTLILCIAICLTNFQAVLAKPSKQELDAYYKLEDKLSPEAGTYLDKKIKAGKDLADWHELQTFHLIRSYSYRIEDIFIAARSAARAEPHNPHVVVTYAIALTLLRKHQAAQELLDKVIKSDQKNARALAAQAYLFADQNANDELAQEEMKAAIKIAPTDPTVNHLALMFYRKLFDYEAAKTALNRWIIAHPNDLYPRMLLAELMRTARHKDQAIKVCREVIAINPNLDWAHHTLINTNYDKQDDKAVISAVNELFNKIPSSKSNYDLINRRAEAYKHLQQYDQALLDYSKACQVILPGNEAKLPPELKTVHEKVRRAYLQNWIGRAAMLVKTDKAKQASDDLTQVLRMFPSNTGALQIRVQAYEAQKKYDLALQDAELLIKKDSDVAEWYKIKASIQRKMGKEADAKATEKRLKEVNEFGIR